MTDLSTEYLGLTLKNPIVSGASPISRSIDSAKSAEDAGAAALVVYSLFEEEILEEEQEIAKLMEFQDLGHFESDSFLPGGHFEQMTKLENYLEHVQSLKSNLDIPIIGSLNCISDSGWAAHAAEIVAAGADALELNINYVPTNIDEAPQDIEDIYINIINKMSEEVKVPVAVKISPQFTAPLNFVHKLKQAGADAVVLFNRFYQPDLNLDDLSLNHNLNLSQTYESLLRMHWLAVIKDKVDIGLSASGGVHGANELIKMLLVGADTAQMASSLLMHGVGQIDAALAGLDAWMESHEYESVTQLKGSFSAGRAPNSWVFERTNYMNMIGKDYKIIGDGSWSET
jgi:dihydroorotate dehydrogenase (fumarate)